MAALTAMIAKDLRDDRRLIEQVRDDRRAAAAQKHETTAKRYSVLSGTTLDGLVDAAEASATHRPRLFHEMRDGVMASSQKIQEYTTHFLGETEEAAARALTDRLRLQVQAVRDPRLDFTQKQLKEAEIRVEHLAGELQVQQHVNVALQRENERLKVVAQQSAIDRDAMIARVLEAEGRVAAAMEARNAAERELARCQEELADLTAANEARATRLASQHTPSPALGFSPTGMTGESALAAAQALEAGMVLTAAGGQEAMPAIPTLAGISLPDEALYRSVILALKRLVDSERRRARLAGLQVLKASTEQQEAVKIILEAVTAATEELREQQQHVLQPSSLTSEGRQALLAALLSEEAVLTAIPSILFPTGQDGRRIGAAAVQTFKAASIK